MATVTSSPSATTLSPPPHSETSKPPALPPLVTNTNTQRRTNSQRPPSYASKRMSTYSNTSKASNAVPSRPGSHVFPAFHSSLPYTLVRDFAYPATHPTHYGPPPNTSGLSTPASEVRRQSDPSFASWEDARGNWSASPPWMSEASPNGNTREQLPAMTFTDGGPPYSEDEDLQSPIVTSSRHKNKKSISSFERGRSPGAAAPDRGVVIARNDRSGGQDFDSKLNLNGPGGVILNYGQDHSQPPQQPEHRDSNFAKPLQRNRRTSDVPEHLSEDEYSGAEDDSDDARFSKDYSFTIASPDEEMHGKAVALFDFTSEHQNELPLKEGQIILVSYRHGQGWLVAQDPRTGESGLVPEEFVRLVRDIEGGLNGLGGLDIDDSDDRDLLSPTSIEPSSEITPTPNGHEYFKTPASAANGGPVVEKHPPVQSTFSTSSKDLDPYPLPRRSDEVGGAVASDLSGKEK